MNSSKKSHLPSLPARKSLGQHFLFDLNITRKIVSLAGDLKDCLVFEIGPGPGGLTRALLESPAQRIIAIEKDPRCIAALSGLVATSNGRLTVIEADALRLDLGRLGHEAMCSTRPLAPSPHAGEEAKTLTCESKSLVFAGGGYNKHLAISPSPATPLVIIANLPYNIASPLLLGWLKNINDFKSMTLMFQAEVADRIMAKSGTKAYGRLSVMAQFCCDVKKVMTLPARAFTPPPKVDSAVVHFTPRSDRPKDIAFEALEKVTAAAFGQRRKMLRSSLKSLGGETLLKKAGIDPTQRAEELSVAEFEVLARQLNQLVIPDNFVFDPATLQSSVDGAKQN